MVAKFWAVAVDDSNGRHHILASMPHTNRRKAHKELRSRHPRARIEFWGDPQMQYYGLLVARRVLAELEQDH